MTLNTFNFSFRRFNEDLSGNRIAMLRIDEGQLLTAEIKAEDSKEKTKKKNLNKQASFQI